MGVVLRREILANGKGRVFINNQPATVGVLRLLAPELALVHAQGETLGSFDQAQQRTLLDRFGGVVARRGRRGLCGWHETQTKLEQMLTDEQDRLRMADLWRFQSGGDRAGCHGRGRMRTRSSKQRSGCWRMRKSLYTRSHGCARAAL